jgi:hypothetical protein
MSMSKSNLQLTSVKIPSELFEEFKIACVKHKFSIQKLAERSMFLYLTDEEFRKTVHNTINTQLKKEE